MLTDGHRWRAAGPTVTRWRIGLCAESLTERSKAEGRSMGGTFPVFAGVCGGGAPWSVTRMCVCDMEKGPQALWTDPAEARSSAVPACQGLCHESTGHTSMKVCRDLRL
ncbi:hypothetical protein DPEC_G00174530 [Dallia pectoralis]|uniref:Uncharacterized protein n=1 Tax=Dallia pectoralis TaxID=75939 RepID=A0ACC2GEA7_DALPE|nr:hypothetical protein DPEC_G00174530 [Dallia pectoralis]